MSDIEHGLNTEKIKADFPVLNQEIYPGKPLIYLDSAATSQKPQSVIDAMIDYYTHYNANIHRGIHALAEKATAAYEGSREKIAKLINSPSAVQCVYTRNTTESINLVVFSWAKTNLKEGDVVILTEMEHHSNLVPWQILQKEINIKLEFIPALADGTLDLEVYKQLLKLEPKIVAFTQMSNVFGTINPAKEMIQLAHQAGAITVVDGAQSVPHMPVDVQDLDVDFLAFSGHKMLGPTGIGVLFGKKALLNDMPPVFGGGDMIKSVALRSFTANDLPHKFEAGTPSIAEGIGMGAAVDYLNQVGMQNIEAFEHSIVAYGTEKLNEIDEVNIFGSDQHPKGSVFSFTIDGIHPHDVAQLMDRDGIAVRAGHHCAMPLHKKFALPATTRASFYIYNSTNELDALCASIKNVIKIFK
ncbi:MAG: cysteine desulfurase [Anaerolineaceae bacterium]|nr:cysteine desulfurase [Anaerolineaceae bacterium]